MITKLKRNIIRAILPVVFLLVILAATGCGGGGGGGVLVDPNTEAGREALFVETFRYVENYFLFQERIPSKYDGMSDQQLGEMLSDDYADVEAFLEDLNDQYTRYISPSDYVNFVSQTSGTVTGIGIYLAANDDGWPEIIGVIEGGPAEDAGLEAGDIIKAVDGVSTEDMALDEVAGRIRGAEGTYVTLLILRGAASLSFAIQREVVSIPSVSYEMLAGSIGYIAVETFSSLTADQFDTAYGTLIAQGMQTLVLDLRDNAGGLLSAGIDIAQRFVPSGVIVSRENKEGVNITYVASPGEYSVTVPFIVLVNEFTASAAEIVSGAINDHDLADLVGDTTYGKGLVQTVYRLSDGGAAIITTDRYLTPDGIDINETGIIPDHAVAQDPVDIENGIDTQLEYAKNLLSGGARIVLLPAANF